jgi:AraC-like DNA-binding protein
VPIDDLSIVALIVTNAENAEDGRGKMNRYAALMLDDGGGSGTEPYEFVRRGGKVWIKVASALYARYPAVTEAAIARCVCGTRRLLTSLGGRAATLRFPEAICFTYPEPAHRAEYDRLFGVPLVFGSDMNAIAVDPVFLSMPMPKPYSAAAALATEHADRLLARVERSRSTRACVEHALLQSLETGPARMEAIARQLGLSRATLLRRLKAEGTTFQEVLETLRHQRAVQLLREEKRSVRQTAHLLGFSDPAAFSRAFKRWTGVSPKEAQRG